MRQQATGRRSRRQTAPSHPPQALQAKEAQEVETVPEDLDALTDIHNELDFIEWYNEVEDSLLETSYDEYHLSQDFQAVELQTSQFQKQCEGLLSAQKRDSELASNIQENLQYYEFLDPASRRLNAPGAGNTVRGKDFSDMLRRLDECLDYMETHPDQKEASVYRSRYRLLMTRALTLIRGHFVSALRDVYVSASKKIADKQLNDTTMSALLYAKFRVGAPELKQIGLEIQKRAVPPLDPDQGAEAEYQSLLNELHANYAATRGKLIVPLVHKNLNDIALAPSTSKDLVAFARGSISYVRGVCLDEFDLWGEWFHGQGGLYDFLETICEPLYDRLRPKIIHEDKIVRLCQLCTLLQTRYLLDQDEETEHTDANQLDFSSLIQPALEDVQTRLVFRAQAFLRDEIERYKPRPEDLDYPARNRPVSISVTEGQISGRKVAPVDTLVSLSSSANQAEDDTDSPPDQDSKWDLESQTALSGWYPTLRKAIWLLSRIYRLVNNHLQSTVFDDLAHQIVHQTIASLQHASSLISSKSAMDGQLFLMSHLLILKQQIVAFDIEYVTPEVSFDFSGMTNTFWELRERGGLFNPRNLIRLVGHGLLPRVVENMLDAKVELDGRLRTVINDFINSFATTMTASLPAQSQFIDTRNRNLHRGELILPTCRLLESEVPRLRKILADYLHDSRMKETLVGAVQDRVIQIYEDFFDQYVAAEKSKGRHPGSTRKGKGHEDAVWDVDTFSEWCEGVFRVGIAMPDDELASRSLSLSRSESLGS
ncbi:hypothetical protein EYZ11_001484 [Aspergillus tanneri]|uniref:Conserved oligomeric Golgi complex subunit 3 n=1 Tax=Aspergillus tanneri TaxID=1220188 RepID=A0A4V3UQG6_9EURO|nr:hypothetical protein EYZ11_001484 [Aspergillus tanneri]